MPANCVITVHNLTGHQPAYVRCEEVANQLRKGTRKDTVQEVTVVTTLNMVSFSSVLMAPVRGIVWVAKLPFVLVWMLLRYVGSCIYAAVAAVLR